jgi:hypothetical protein
VTRRSRGSRPLAAQLVRELGAGRRPGPVLLLWRWRWELGVVATGCWLAYAVPPHVLLPAVGVIVASCVGLPALRQLVRGRFWCVATQHRLRTGLRESDVRSWSGRMPAVVWTSARPHGEHVLLACPAGVDIARIAAARRELAGACWAVDVAVQPHPRYANLAAVDVLRRSPKRRQS